NALMDREVGLTRREVNLIMGHLERKYPDGTFDVNDVAHEAFELLFEAHEDNLLQLPLNEQAAHDVLMQTFQSLDTEKTGELAVPETQNGLFLADLGLTGLQTHALLGLLADLNVSVDYGAFAEYISSWVAQILQGTDLRNPSNTVANLERNALQDQLLTAFQKQDPKQTGTISYAQMTDVINGFSFSPREKSAVLSLVIAQANEEEGVSYDIVARTAFDVCWLQQRLGLDLVE
ncbi:MAG: hypothetical protein EZS28_043972, partial [Streblomastix strix]